MDILRDQRAKTTGYRQGGVIYLLALVGVGSVFALLTGYMKIEMPSLVQINDKETTAKTRQQKVVKNIEDTCLDPNGPQPVVLMSLGRSGSASTWQILSNITGYETRSIEYTGGGYDKARHFFKGIEDENPNAEDYGDWVTDYLCEQQRKYPDAGIVGFKWKPFPDSFFTKPAKDGLTRIANANIKVIRSRRNTLDVHMSRVKHKSLKVPAHCGIGDEECLKKHQAAIANQELPNVHKLHKNLFDLWSGENNVDRYMEENNIPTVDVSFEKMYFPESPEEGTEEWKKILVFLLGEDHEIVQSMTWDTISHAMGHAATSSMKPHRDILGNYDEVYRVLKGTEVEHLIRQ